MVPKPLRQCYGIVIKNLGNHLTNKKKLLGQLLFPSIISALYVLVQTQKQSNPLISMIFSILLKMYIAMIGLSAVKELVTLFLNERQQKHRQYQMIFGLSTRCHTLSNLLYMGLYMSLFLVPFYVVLNYYSFDIRYVGMFAAFVISSLTCAMMMTAFFNDHKIATQIIGIFFSLSSFLALMYSGGTKDQAGNITYTTLDYIAMFIPNSSFSIAIMYNNGHASLLSMSIVKIYLLTYSIIEFPHQYKQLFEGCKRKLGQWCGTQENSRNLLTEEFNLGDQVSESGNESSNDKVDGNNVMVRITNLVKTYKIKQGQFNALNKLNLTIKKRQIFGLLGRNGAGKTTLVDILTDVFGPTSGEFVINYEKASQQSQDAQKIGICYQHQIQYEELTVEQHLYFYCRIKGVQNDYKQVIDNIVQMLGIRDEFGKKAKQLSGGNKRKLSIAIAVLGNPELMIFDQPTSGLDPLARRSVWDILEKLRRDYNSSIILTTHHLDQAQVLSDWICVIQKGGILVQNSPDQIKAKYGNGYYLTLQFTQTSHLKKDLPSITKHLESKLQKVQILQEQNNRAKLFLKFPIINLKFGIKQQEQLLLDVLQWLDKVQNVKIEVEKNSLQQSFIAILKDPENGLVANSSGDSIELSNVLQRPVHYRKTIQDLQNESVFQKISLMANQVLGVFIRCIYFHKGQSLKFFLIYNINIIMFIFAMMFNKFIAKVLKDGTEDLNEYSKAINGDKQTQNQSYSNSMLILQGYVIMASAFIAVPIYQKEKNIRRVLNSRGVSPLAYWLGNFMFDFGYYLINLLIMSKLISPSSFTFLQQQNKSMLTLVSLGIGMIVYTYCFSNIFQKVTTANTWFSIINMLFGFILLPMIILGKSTFLRYFEFIKYLYPYYDLNLLMMKDTMSKAGGAMMGAAVIGDGQSQEYVWYSIVIWVLVMVAVQVRLYDRLKQLVWDRKQVQLIQNNIQLRQVSKSYQNVQALKNVSYHLNNQRLALLGHNGAGKSTTFGLLSGQINPTSGSLFLQHRTKLNHEKILTSAGICYQEDCLWQNMTPLEIFNIFSYLVPIEQSGKQIEWLLESLEFEAMNFTKRFENLSGGNKRKICMAVALFGDPMIRLLDQCSTGLDPSSRVAMVQTIKHSLPGSTIFTTHSMSQAQTLCSKAVIMSKGSVLQFDYIYKLKEKYYNCYWIDVVFKKFQQSLNQLDGDDSFVENNIQLIIQELRQVVSRAADNSKLKIGKTLKPKIIKPTKQNKIRIQFDKQVWPLHVALAAIYQLRDRLALVIKQQPIQTVYISQPKLQDIYIQVTSQDQQNHIQVERVTQKVYLLEQQDTSKGQNIRTGQQRRQSSFIAQEIELMKM